MILIEAVRIAKELHQYFYAFLLKDIVLVGFKQIQHNLEGCLTESVIKALAIVFLHCSYFENNNALN